MKEIDFLHYKPLQSFGSEESTEVRCVMDIKDNKTYVVVEHSVSERFELKDYNKAKDLYERLTCGSGRKMYKPSDLAHHYNSKN